MHGEGQYFWADGSFYKGRWVSDSRSGQGIERLSDGSQYEGDFAGNARNGLGSMLYLDGSKYEGTWQNENWNGHGKFISADGSSLEGTFVDGIIHGHGIERDANDDFFYEGDWKNGVKEGRGQLKTKIGDYNGEFVAGKKHGSGSDSFASGSKYIGQFIENQRHGHGTMSHSNGCIYDGGWKFGECCGQGKYVESNGYGYSGEWENDLKHGHGIETIDRDTSYEGQFYKGTRHGKGRTTTFKAAPSTMQSAESQTGHCIHEGMYAKNMKCGVGSEIYPDGSCFHGVWSNGMRHGPGLLKIASDATYHVIFNDDTIVDIFYSMELEGPNGFSSSVAESIPDGQNSIAQVLPMTDEQTISLPGESHVVTERMNTSSSKGVRGRSVVSTNINQVRFDPFEGTATSNSVNKSSSKPVSSPVHSQSDSVHVKPPIDFFPSVPFSDFAAEDRSDVYDLDELDLYLPHVSSSLSGLQAELPQPPQVTVVVDYGIWGSPSMNDSLHSVPFRAPHIRSVEPDRVISSQFHSKSDPAMDIQQQPRRSHASRHQAGSAKQHRVPGATSKESVASSRSKITNKIDIFNL